MNSKQVKALLVSMVMGINLTACKSSKNLEKEDNIELNKVSYDTFINDLNNINRILETNKEYQRIKEVSLDKNVENLKWVGSNCINISYEENDSFVKGIFDYFGNTLFFNERIVSDSVTLDYTSYKIGDNYMMQYHYFAPDIGNLTIGVYPPYRELKISYNSGRVEISLDDNNFTNIVNSMKEYASNNDYFVFLNNNKELIKYYLEEIHIPKKYHLNGNLINAPTFVSYVDTLNNNSLLLKR